MKIKAIDNFSYKGAHVEAGTVLDDVGQEDGIILIRLGRAVATDGDYTEPSGPLTTESAQPIVKNKPKKGTTNE